EKFDSYFLENGFFKYQMPENLKINEMNWTNQSEFYQELTKKKKGHFRRNILKNIENYNLVIKDDLSDSEIETAYKLYLNVKQKSLEINTFTLPIDLFKNMAKNEKWEILFLYLNGNNGLALSNDPVAVGF